MRFAEWLLNERKLAGKFFLWFLLLSVIAVGARNALNPYLFPGLEARLWGPLLLSGFLALVLNFPYALAREKLAWMPGASALVPDRFTEASLITLLRLLFSVLLFLVTLSILSGRFLPRLALLPHPLDLTIALVLAGLLYLLAEREWPFAPVLRDQAKEWALAGIFGTLSFAFVYLSLQGLVFFGLLAALLGGLYVTLIVSSLRSQGP